MTTDVKIRDHKQAHGIVHGRSPPPRLLEILLVTKIYNLIVYTFWAITWITWVFPAVNEKSKPPEFSRDHLKMVNKFLNLKSHYLWEGEGWLGLFVLPGWEETRELKFHDTYQFLPLKPRVLNENFICRECNHINQNENRNW